MKPDNSKWIILGIVAAVIGAFVGPTIFNSMSGGVAALIVVVFFVGVIGFIIWSLAANKVGKTASAAEMAKARAMTPMPGTARIYVVRRGFMGGMAGMKVDIRGVASGQIRMNQFVMAEVQPGTYTIETAMARNGVKPSNSETEFTLQNGEVLVILVMLQLEAMHARTVQQRIGAPEAQTQIASAKMIQWTTAANVDHEPLGMHASSPQA